MAGVLENRDERRPIRPGDPEYLALRAMHAKRMQQIATRGMTDRAVQYRRLQQLVAEVKRARW